MNYISIDPSLISTAVVVNGKLFNFCRKSDSHNKSGLSKWFKLAENYITLIPIDLNTADNYSDLEIAKINSYDIITDNIIKLIFQHIDESKPTRIAIEGYSYSSNAGAIIDLVCFSSLLRVKLYNYVSQDIKILAPTSLKLESCKLTYPGVDIGIKKAKIEYRNYEGLAGGKFTKKEMYLAITENGDINSEYANQLRNIQEDVFMGKKIPKPFEDVNDAYLIYQLLKNNKI